MSSEKYQMLAKTFAGLEEVLKGELIELGASDVEVIDRGVKFTGSKEILYKANFCCRTALQILRFLGEFKIYKSDEIYTSISSINWSEIFDIKQSFGINSFADSEAFNNSMFVSLKTKDAIVDHFKNNFKKRPINCETPNITIHVLASSDTLTVLLDSSGELLSKRGYRIGQNDASMNDVLAAGILKLAGWKGQTDFYDIMCGSGTIPVEAAFIARNIPPGMFRSEFAFEKWKDFDADLLAEVYNEDYEIDFDHHIYASDISGVSVNVAIKNAKSAGVLKSIEFKEADLSTVTPESDKGILVINPPQADRKNERLIESVYSLVGHQLKKSFQGFNAWVYSNSEIGFKKIGLRPSTSFEFFNSNNESSFRQFELYSGSKKESDKPFDRSSTSSELGQRDFKSGGRREESRPDNRREGGRPDFKREGGGRREEGRSDFKREGGRRDDVRPVRRRESGGSDFRKEGGKPDFRKGGRPEGRPSNGRFESKSNVDDADSRRAKFHSDRLRGPSSFDPNAENGKSENKMDEFKSESNNDIPKPIKKRKRIRVDKNKNNLGKD